MKHFLYPDERKEWAAEHNAAVRNNSFRAGTFGVAIDVWRDNNLMFSSYEKEQSEPLDAFCQRNYPTITNVDYENCAMSAFVQGIDRFDVPLKSALNQPLSLTAIHSLIFAAFKTAMYPYDDDPPTIHTEGSMRQAWQRRPKGRDFLNLKYFDIDNQIAVRAVLGKVWETDPQLSTYEVAFVKRETARLEGDRDPMKVTFRAPRAFLHDTEDRRPIVKQAKKLTGLTGAGGAVIRAEAEAFHWRCGELPYDLKVVRVADHTGELKTVDERFYI